MWDVLSGIVPLKGFRRPSPLSVFARGFEGSLPKFYEFKQDGYKQGETSVGEESILSVSGKLDFAFIIQMVIDYHCFSFSLVFHLGLFHHWHHDFFELGSHTHLTRRHSCRVGIFPVDRSEGKRHDGCSGLFHQD